MRLVQRTSPTKFVYSLVFFAALSSLAGCDSATELKDKTAGLLARITGDRVNPKYPVSAETQRVLALAIELAEGDARREAIRNSHNDWLKLRESHCGAMERLEKEGASSTAAGCYANLDKQRTDDLNQIRMALLLGKDPLPAASKMERDTSIAFEERLLRNQIVVAPGNTLAAVSTPRGEIEIYDLVSGQLIRNFNEDRHAVTAQFSGNGRLLMVGKQLRRGLKVFDVYSGDLLKEITEVMGPYVALDGGRLLVHADSSALGIYDVISGKPLVSGLFAKSTIRTLAVSSSNKFVATATRDGWVALWEIVPIGDSGAMTARLVRETRLYGGSEVLTQMEFLENDQQLFAVSSKGDLELIDVPTLQRTRTMEIPRLRLRSLSRVAGTDRFVLLSAKNSGQGNVLALLDFATDTGTMQDESRQFLAVTPVGGATGKLLFVNSDGMWTKDLPTVSTDESLADLVVRIATLTAPQVSSSQLVPPTPMAPNILPNTRVEAVGVYEGALPGGRKRKFRETATGTVTVAIGSMQAPLALVLTSYDPVNWIVQPGKARITHILLSGSAESTVSGAPGADIMRIGSAHAYPGQSGTSSGGISAVNADVMRYLGRGIDRLQGAYTGSSFSIGPPSAAETAGARKWTDANGQVHYSDQPPQ